MNGDNLIETIDRLKRGLHRIDSIVTAMDIERELEVIRARLLHTNQWSNLGESYSELDTYLAKLEEYLPFCLEALDEIEDGYKDYLGECE